MKMKKNGFAIAGILYPIFVLFLSLLLLLIAQLTQSRFQWNKTKNEVLASINGEYPICDMKIDTSDSYIENNVPYFMVTLSNYKENQLIGTGLKCGIKVTNAEGSTGLYSYIDEEGNKSEAFEPGVETIRYRFGNNQEEKRIRVFVKSENQGGEGVHFQVDLDYMKQSGTITIPSSEYCMANGFTKLSDCMLVMENYAPSVSEAMKYIGNKGAAKTTSMAPNITYKEITNEMNNSNGVITTNNHFTLGKSYTFNEKTGMFTIQDYVNVDLSDAYVNYYTCGSTSSSWTSCATLYQVKAYTKTSSSTTTTYRVTQAIKHTYQAVDSFDSEIGLYQIADDLGNSYVYRGNVKNNYVSYGGFIWRIVRRNGDGSVRMIYAGTSPTDTGSKTAIGTSAYNEKYWDPTYVGYQYQENFGLTVSNTDTNYSNIADNTNYYYGSSYSFDESTKKFKLTGNTTSGKWKEVSSNVIANYPYTCLSTSASGTCNFVLKLKKYVNSYTATVNYISYSSKDYGSTLVSKTDSTIKEKIESWYQANLLNGRDSKGNAWTSYLVDGTFCNDRELNSGNGYTLAPTSYYKAYNRIASQKQPSLSCKQTSDVFQVANGKLKYPVGLLTIDEASLAGGLVDSVNTNYYLYTGQTYWTMSPSYFSAGAAYARAWYVTSTGYLGANWVATAYGVRPVVNLSKDIFITSGDGSMESPYIVAK